MEADALPPPWQEGRPLATDGLSRSRMGDEDVIRLRRECGKSLDESANESFWGDGEMLFRTCFSFLFARP